MNRNFGPYEIRRELGRGAMGVVFLAVHRSLQRDCALKTIAMKIADRRAAERFVHEGQAVARLGKHPNIVQVFDAGIVDETPYIAMEYVPGETLDARVARLGPLPESETVEFGRKLAMALDHAHRRGIVHRDVKPANILMDSTNEPHLLDFGIAKDLSTFTAPSRSLDESGATAPPPVPIAAADGLDATFTGPVEESMEEATIVGSDLGLGEGRPARKVDEGIQGTPAFMAPEQADPRRGPVDARADVYALGTTLYVLATAQRPFEANTLTEMLVRVVREDPPPPSGLAIISPDLEAVILKAMEKDPGDRYQTALEFADDLSRVAMGLPTRARKLGRLGRVWKYVRIHQRLLMIAAAFVFMIGVATIYFRYRSQEIQALWNDIAERTARATSQEVESLLDSAAPMLEECVALAEADLLPVDDPELLARHLVARFRFQKKLSWLSYGDEEGRFTGAWRHPSGRIVIQRSWLDDKGGHIREEFADGDRKRLRWNDEWTYDPRSRPFYSLASRSKEPVWTKPYEWFGDDGLGITAAFANRQVSTDTVRGVFTADYHLGTLADFLANLKLGKQGRAYLLGRNGELLASPERDATSHDALLTAAIRASDAAIPGRIQNLPFDDPRSFSFLHDGRDYVAAIEASEPADGLPVLVMVLVPEDDIVGPVKAAATWTVQIVCGLATLAVLLSLGATLLQKRRLRQALTHRKRRRAAPAVESPFDATSIAGASTESSD